jgi:hypothetical protein
LRQQTAADDVTGLPIDHDTPRHALLERDCNDQLPFTAHVDRLCKTIALQATNNPCVLGPRQTRTDPFVALGYRGFRSTGAAIGRERQGGEWSSDEELTTAHASISPAAPEPDAAMPFIPGLGRVATYRPRQQTEPHGTEADFFRFTGAFFVLAGLAERWAASQFFVHCRQIHAAVIALPGKSSAFFAAG